MAEHDQITPHGGTLVNLLAGTDAAAALAAEAANLPKLVVGERELSDLEMLAVGALSPLTGFQGEADYRSVLDSMHLANGLPWAIPVVLSVSEEQAHQFGSGGSVALLPAEGADALAVLRVSETFKRDKAKEAVSVYRTDDTEHPGVKAVYEAGDYCVAGTLEVISLPEHDDFQNYRLTPAETRAVFAERGWKTVVGFQTRNPIHRAHEYIQKCALEIVDGLLVHPLVGATKGDDVPADVRMRCYEALVRGLLPEGPRHGERVPRGDALRGAARGDLARDLPQELRVHALHRGSRPRRGGLLLRHLRRPADLRRVRARRAGHHHAELRALVLVRELRGHGVAEDLPPRRGDAHLPVAARRSARCCATASVRRRSSPAQRSPTS